MTLEAANRIVLVAVDPEVPGMSRLADILEAEPALPSPTALRQRAAVLDRHRDEDLIGVVIPTTHPETILEAARIGLHRIAAYHPRGQRFTPWQRSLNRAAFALVDLTFADDEETLAEAIAAGADPDRAMVLGDGLVDRLFGEPPRKARVRSMMEGIVSLGLDAIAASGLLRALELAAPRRGVNVVNYHRVLPLDELQTYCRPQMAISAPTFAAQLADMSARRGFAPVTRLRDTDARDKVAITFDDGYEDNFRVALPILERFSTPACIFVVTGLVGRPGALFWDQVGLSLFAWWRAGCPGEVPADLPERTKQLKTTTSAAETRTLISEVLSDLNLVDDGGRRRAVAAARALVPQLVPGRTMLTWEEIRALSKAGITFGSHTRSHIPLDELPAEEAREELLGSHDDLDENLGEQDTRVTALPRGRLGDLTEGDLQESFDAVMTTDAGVNAVETDDLFIKRRDGRMLTLAGRHHPAKLRLELTGIVDQLRRVYYALGG